MRGYACFLLDGKGVVVWGVGNCIDKGFIGRRLWDLLDKAEVQECQNAYMEALLHGSSRPRTFLIGDSLWRLEFSSTAVSDHPMAGIAHEFSAKVRWLTNRERDVARLMPVMPSKEIAVTLGIAVPTAETLRQRVGLKVGLRGPALIAWCEANREIL